MRYQQLVLVICALLAGFTAFAPSARAAESYDNCTGFIESLPANISTQGTWCLRKDLSTSISSGIAGVTIATNNVTIDCNGFKIGGLAGGSGTAAIGIASNDRFNTTVRNCSIRGFSYGIWAHGGGGHKIESNSLDGNTYIGLRIYAAQSTIRGNVVYDTGGSSLYVGSAVGIATGYGVDILDNTIDGVAASGTNASAFGIHTDENADASITGNRVRGLASVGSGTTFGIFNSNSGRLSIRDNDVRGHGGAGSIGIRCFDNRSSSRDNIVAGFEIGVAPDCSSFQDMVNMN